MSVTARPHRPRPPKKWMRQTMTVFASIFCASLKRQGQDPQDIDDVLLKVAKEGRVAFSRAARQKVADAGQTQQSCLEGPIRNRLRRRVASCRKVGSRATKPRTRFTTELHSRKYSSPEKTQTRPYLRTKTRDLRRRPRPDLRSKYRSLGERSERSLRR